jgi:TPR repeat protein
LFKKAADNGLPFAMYNLGNIYSEGKYVTKDHTKARGWYEKSAAAGDTWGMYSLGQYFFDGLGGPKNEVEARRWMEKSATEGNSAAMGVLGWYHQRGIGGPKDVAEARRWYNKAIAAGSTNAIVAENLRGLNQRQRGPQRARSGSQISRGRGSGVTNWQPYKGISAMPGGVPIGNGYYYRP